MWTFLYSILCCPSYCHSISHCCHSISHCLHLFSLFFPFCPWKVRVSYTAGITLLLYLWSHPSHLCPDFAPVIILSWYSTWSFLLNLERSAHPKIKCFHTVPASSPVLSFCFLLSSLPIGAASILLLSDPFPPSVWLLFCPHHSGEATQQDSFRFSDPMTSFHFPSLTLL